MKVKELIEQLSKMDPEAMVVVDGYEGGVDELKKITEEEVYLNVHHEYYYGSHELSYNLFGAPQDCQKTKVIYIPRP